MLIHTVTNGETLFSIAEKYGVSADILAFNNDINPDAPLPTGLALAVVIPTLVHTVSEGETLLDIARSYGVSVYSLWRNNPILNGKADLYPGQSIYITLIRNPIGSYETGGYAYPFISSELLNRTLPFVGAVMPFTYGFRSDGSLVMLSDASILESAGVYGTFTVMHLSTLTESGNFSSELARKILNDTEARQQLFESVLANIQAKGYRALDIDFEFLGAENAQAYADFVSFFRENLNPLGYGVMTALAPKTSREQKGILYEGHDYAALGAAANAVLLMTYEWGYTYGPPLAVSPIGSVERVINFALTEIPSSKIFLGISNYGYDFKLPYIRGESRAKSISTAQAYALASETGSEILYDAASQAPFFYYTDSDGAAHVVWFEDVRSLSARLNLLSKYSLKGALYWNFDRRNSQNLVLLNDIIDFKSFSLI